MRPGQKTSNNDNYAYMIISNREVIRVKIQSEFGGLYTVRFPNGGATKVKSHRLYPTAEAANEEAKAYHMQQRRYRTPYE